MAVQPEGSPCWADAMFADVEAAKSFYGDVLGWTFAETSAEFGDYTQAFVDGRAVAAVVPPMPGQEGTSQWCLYLAAADAAATAARIRENGGELLMEPMRVGGFGTMCLARDPGGVVFGLWQAGTHEGFGVTAEPGAYCWAEVFTREPEKSDAFFPAVFPYRSRELEGEMDFRVYDLGERSVLGRMRMTDDFPPEMPPYVNVYFSVADCDEAVARATARGGVLRFGPMDTPFGRFAAISDPQGANFSVIDLARTTGELPRTAAAD
ncbi:MULTISPECIES: VOC family protein [Streptomyces]|uniref:Hydrolase n=1 Tax=Streptomyces fungicidicus TaxID=68203 RepID=A0A494V925_9ACTN|nr:MULTISPECIES: VOC family protein [Streptomyces]AYL40064.1 hydrolase [Streptomyces fungicidicus]QKW04005.1 VOC family protein [Streptomyces sp. NA02536]